MQSIRIGKWLSPLNHKSDNDVEERYFSLLIIQSFFDNLKTEDLLTRHITNIERGIRPYKSKYS